MIAVIDYGAGNLQSVVNALEAIDQKPLVTNNPKALARSSAIILPGVGAFGDGMRMLNKLHLIETLNEQVLIKKKPYLGICLGLQFLAEKGFEHGEHKGLGWIRGAVVKITPKSKKYRVPHIGWNSTTIHKTSPLFENVGELIFYFVHSYHLELDSIDKKSLVASCWHGQQITAAIQKDNIFGVQFHPEKSQQDGLLILKNFIKVI